MKKVILIVAIFCISFVKFGYSQINNGTEVPYIEVSAQADTLVMPNNIYISIELNEKDSKNRTPLSEQEIKLQRTLKSLDINPEKDLFLEDAISQYVNYFWRGQKVSTAKYYTLLVHDAATTDRVLSALANVGISNLSIAKTEYANPDELILTLKEKAIIKSKKTADRLAAAIGQKAGKAFYISDFNNNNVYQQYIPMLLGMAAETQTKNAEPAITNQFQKVKYKVTISAKYKLD